MKIYITGIAGFLGSHLAKRLKKLGHDISGNDNLILGDVENLPDNIKFDDTDCSDYDQMVKNLKGFDIVYHCAATAHEGLSVFSPNFITKNIYQASVSVITASIVNNVKKFVFCSSMARYGNQQVPFKEDMSTKPEDPYGIAKVAAEDTLKLLSEVHGMDYNIAVPHNIVGPNQKYNDPFRNVMSIFINRNLQGEPSIIYGDGMQQRCFSYIDDVIFCLEKLALDSNISKETINIGPDEETTTILELSKLVANETGYNGKPIFVKDRPKEVKFASCSSDKARKLLGYETKTSLKESVKLTADFVKQRGIKKFDYNLPLEINSEITPETWKFKKI
ncbi:NAD-dependent epimerase/dehydratase family protein [Candidatus Pelagibacter sp.]|nr:NAD-dependent epimerase/dehydratase family protein [Candidatus Pelagibacter sp.]